MITQETKSVKTYGGFNLAILKVNLNPLSWKNRSSYNKTYKPSTLNFLLLPTSRTYWHDHVQVPNPRTLSFLDSPPNTSTPTCVSLGFNGSNWIDSSRWRKLLLLENPKFMWRKAPQRSYKRFTQAAI